MENLKKKSILPADFKMRDKIFFAAAFTGAFLFMSHPDLWETANHSYVFLESVFSGNFMDFYGYCAAHNNSYYYLNAANYNIAVYMLFGLWELPVFIFNKIFSLALNERFLIFWAKAVSAAFFAGCGIMTEKIALLLGMEKDKAKTAAMFFVFNPVAFYSPMAMGQYDSICLFFILWALCFYLKGDMIKFSFVTGAGMVFKFFPMLVFLPLLLLAQKKPLEIAKNFLVSLWLYIPTTLLFLGRNGNASAFTGAMIDRMFELTLDTGFGKMPVFVAFYAILLFACFVYSPKGEKGTGYTALYICMAVFEFLMCCIYRHPQWVMLMIPFMVITTFSCREKSRWFLLDMVISAGFLFTCYIYFPNQTGASLFSGGILGGVSAAAMDSWRPISYFLNLVPYLTQLVPVMFCGGIVCHLIFKFPVAGRPLADRLSGDSGIKIKDKNFCILIFAVGFLGLWLVPSLAELLNAAGIL